jgi:hypothetical protein
MISVRHRSRTPQLHSICPDWFGYCFVYEDFVVCGEILFPSKYWMRFGERHSQLLPCCEHMFAPGKSPVEMQPEILEIPFALSSSVTSTPRRGCRCHSVDPRSIIAPNEILIPLYRPADVRENILYNSLCSV